MTRVRWTEAKIRELAPQFSSRTEMSKLSRGAYRYAGNIPGLLDELYGNQKFVWTREDLIAEASRYGTKSEFQAGSGGAYVACNNRFPGLLDTLFDNQIRFWKDEQEVLAEARKYKSRTEFMRLCSGGYKSAAAKFPHILEDVFGESPIAPWSLDGLVTEASKYESRAALRLANSGAYASFSKFPGELDKIFPPVYRYWGDEADIRTEASKYRTKSEFIRGCVSAYQAALALGIIDDLGFEPTTSGFNTVVHAHLYLAELPLADGTDSVLFGITNRHPKDRYKLKERVLMSNKISYVFDVGSDALRAETFLRRRFAQHAAKLGQSPLLEKSGTAGEIVCGVPITVILNALGEHCSPLPKAVEW